MCDLQTSKIRWPRSELGCWYTNKISSCRSTSAIWRLSAWKRFQKCDTSRGLTTPSSERCFWCPLLLVCIMDAAWSSFGERTVDRWGASPGNSWRQVVRWPLFLWQYPCWPGEYSIWPTLSKTIPNYVEATVLISVSYYLRKCCLMLSLKRKISRSKTMVHSALSFLAFGRHLLGLVTELRKATISFAMSICFSVCQHGTTRLILDGFWWKFIFELLPKVCWENKSFIKIRQE